MTILAVAVHRLHDTLHNVRGPFAVFGWTCVRCSVSVSVSVCLVSVSVSPLSMPLLRHAMPPSCAYHVSYPVRVAVRLDLDLDLYAQ